MRYVWCGHDAPYFWYSTECPQCEKMLLISSFILSTPSIHQSQPASTCATRLLLSPPRQPSPIISLSHESRLSSTAFPSQICADLWVSSWSAYDTNITNSSGSVSQSLHSMYVSGICISAWMNAAVVWCVCFGCGLEGLTGCSRGGGGSRGVGVEEVRCRSVSCLSGLCGLGVHSALHTTQSSTSVTHLPLTVHRTHRFLAEWPWAHLFHATFVSLFPVTASSWTRVFNSTVTLTSF